MAKLNDKEVGILSEFARDMCNRVSPLSEMMTYEEGNSDGTNFGELEKIKSCINNVASDSMKLFLTIEDYKEEINGRN